jgi:7 transmembrane sweet-taste receptor of 3 GCPR
VILLVEYYHELSANVVLLSFKDSSASQAIRGTGLVQMLGGKTSDRIVQGRESTPVFDQNATSGFERFRSSWRDALQDEEFVSFVKSKLPESLNATSGFNIDDDFANEPTGCHPFLYDAVTVLGVSMCQINASSIFFTGKDLYSQFLGVDIDSASGNIRVAMTGTRDFATISFVIWNVRVAGSDSDGFSILEFVPSFHYVADTWEVIPGNEFQYANGSIAAPDSLPPVSHDYNYINKSDRIFSYTLMSFVMVSSICAIAWTFVCRKSHVVNSSQPIFLVMTSVGAFIMSLAIYPAGLDETVVSSLHGLDVACMAIPWLYFLGTNIAFGALLAKTRAVHQVCFLT